MLENTSLFDPQEIETALISKDLFEVFEAMEECGYKPLNQLTGYILTRDSRYITNYKRCREKIEAISMEKLIAILVEGYFNK